ncbi:MAG TPA: exopolysaccharide biosynthesis polyprenyl glycosylphosphotransferase [Terrimicrobiaceae bacterium]
MLWNRIRGLWNAYHGILAVVLTVLYWIFLTAVSPMLQGGAVESYSRFILYNLAAIVGLIIAAVRGRSAAATLLAGGFVNYHTLALKQTVYIGVTLLLVMALGMEPEFRHMRLAVLFGFLGAVYATFLICHFFVPNRLADHLFSEEHEQRTLLVGPVDKARAVNKWILETAAFGFGLRGSRSDDDSEEGQVLHVTRVSDVAMLQRIIRHEGIRQILLLELPLDQEGLNLVVDAANKAGVRLLVLNNLPEIFRHDISFFNLNGKDFISLRDEPLEDPVNRIIKRTVDILMSLPVVLFVLPPLCLVVKIFQGIQSPGPLFYRQTRAGLNNLPFRIFKFRTMRIDKGDDASKQATAGDPRIYPMGRILRKTSLDEIPQFLNVFFGDMSVVGPRPHMIIHNRRFSEVMEAYHVRTFAKPGITGLAQMSGYRGEAKNDQDVVERAQLDIKYIENWSLPFDFWIILNTMYQVFRPPKTAY